MYDKFEAFQRLNKQDFGFMPSRYEIWQGGQKIKNGNTNSQIIAKVIDVAGEEKVLISFIDDNLNHEISRQNIYDDFITPTDRLQLITVPEQANSGNNMAMQIFKMTIGTTRPHKDFESHEPFCCNLFILNGSVDKVTFTFTNPDKLIEFYSDTTTENTEEIILDYEFESSDHIRYENGKRVAGPHGGARRMIKIQPNITGDKGYTVSTYNLDGDHPVWQNNIQMSPKQMRIIETSDDKIVLRGFGADSMGNSFADYGLSLIYQQDVLIKCILHMHDRGVDIEYLNEVEEDKTKNTKNLIAVGLLTLLIEEHEDGDSLVLQSNLQSELKEKLGNIVTSEEISEAVSFLNSFYNRPIIIEQWVQSGEFMSVSSEAGFYTEMTKSFLRDTINTIN